MKKYYLIIGLAVLIILIIVTRKKTGIMSKTIPIGIRNKNPGNIRKTKSVWNGEVDPSTVKGGFKAFITFPYGYRAIFVILRSYIEKHNVNTIEKIITRYAPPSDGNATERYIKHVSQRVGISPTKKVQFSDVPTMKKLVKAIVKSEVGINANDNEIDQGYNLI